MLNWKEFISQEMKGKKYNSRDEVNDAMKKLSEEYKKLKEQKLNEIKDKDE